MTTPTRQRTTERKSNEDRAHPFGGTHQPRRPRDEPRDRDRQRHHRAVVRLPADLAALRGRDVLQCWLVPGIAGLPVRAVGGGRRRGVGRRRWFPDPLRQGNLTPTSGLAPVTLS